MGRLFFTFTVLATATFGRSHLTRHANLTRLHQGIDVVLDAVVDANLSAMHHVFHPGNICPFQRKIMSKMGQGGTVNIEILGGSATIGADLPRREEQRWSTKVQSILNNGWYNGTFTVTNRAIPACNIDAWIYQTTRFKEADLVLVDLSVNDQGFDLPVLPHYYQTLVQLLGDLPNHPAIMFVQTFRKSKDPKEIERMCPGAEKNGKCCETVWWCKKWWDMQDFVTVTLKRYRVPYISYRDLVWPVYSNPPPTLAALWNGDSHPDAKNHALYGKMVAYGIMRQFMQAHAHDAKRCALESNGRYITGDDIDKTIVGICSEARTKMFANESGTSIGNFRLSHSQESGEGQEYPPMWRFYNESGTKFGWILEQTEASFRESCAALSPLRIARCSNVLQRTTISFEVEFGANPTLQVAYLKSWSEDMGAAVLWVDNAPENNVTLESYWKDEFSVTHYTTIISQTMANVSAIVMGEHFVVPSLKHGKHIVHIAAPSFAGRRGKYKFKLIGLTSC